MKKRAAQKQSIEAEIVDFLKMEKTIDYDTKRRGITVNEEWVKELLWRCSHVHWVAMEEHEKRVSGEGRAELHDDEGWCQTGMSRSTIEHAKAFFAQWNVQKRGGTGANMHPPGGPPIRPLHDVYMEVWASWVAADELHKVLKYKDLPHGKFSPNTSSARYGHDPKRLDRHEYWNSAARLLLKIVRWLGYSEQNVTGLIETMRRKRGTSPETGPARKAVAAKRRKEASKLQR